LNAEAQQIAIAEACGWKPQHNYYWLAPKTDYPLISGGQLPDFLNDLNAMHKAEKVLTHGQDVAYRLRHLPVVCEPSQPLNGNIGKAVTATSAQRAEAFLRTLNLWEGT
jgi:hypothetical protein